MAIRAASVVRVTLPGFTGPFATFFKVNPQLYTTLNPKPETRNPKP